jgi:transcriptional regulator with XRE-family HTH domain
MEANSSQKLANQLQKDQEEAGYKRKFAGKWNSMHLGGLIKEAIQKARMSYSEVAERLNIGKQTVAYTVQQDDVYAKRLAVISQITGQNLVKELEREFDLAGKKTKRPLPADPKQAESEVVRLRREKQELVELLRLTGKNFDHYIRLYEEAE